MRTIRRAFLFFGFLVACLAGHAATHVVNGTNSIQAAIDAASSGDKIFVNPGFYSENLMVDGKAIEIRGLGATRPRSLGLTVKNVNGAFRISHFKVNDNPDWQLEVIDSNNVTFEDFNGTEVNATRSNLTMKNCQLPKSLSVDSGSLKLLKSTVTENVEVNHPVDHNGADTQLVVLQSTIGEDLRGKAKRSWVCYNTIRQGYFEGTVDITGNDFNGRENFVGVGIDLNGTTTAKIRNNLIRKYKKNENGNQNEKFIGIIVREGVKATITNNVIYDCADPRNLGVNVNCGMGIFVKPGAGTTVIMGNAIWNCSDASYNKTGGNRLVHAPNTVNLSYNNLIASTPTSGGVINVSGLNIVNQGWTGGSGINYFQLASNSPLIDKGPPDARYNDRDGSRNDIGMFGGHEFIPNGMTTDKPIPIKLSTTPAFVPVGGTVTIESTGATPK